MSKIVANMFIKASIVYLLIGCVWGAIMTLPPVHEFVEEGGPAGIIGGMHAHWNLLGWVSLAVMGGIYYLVPVVVGKDLYSERLARIHFWIFNIAIVVGTILALIAGYLGGTLYLAEEFAAIEPTIGPYMMMVVIISWIEAAVNFLFAYVIYKTIRR
ncbi:MAG: cbb3-type cytochrome c oxidase subunit I [Candidatus Bathyarchaeia archaeon]